MCGMNNHPTCPTAGPGPHAHTTTTDTPSEMPFADAKSTRRDSARHR